MNKLYYPGTLSRVFDNKASIDDAKFCLDGIIFCSGSRIMSSQRKSEAHAQLREIWNTSFIWMDVDYSGNRLFVGHRYGVTCINLADLVHTQIFFQSTIKGVWVRYTRKLVLITFPAIPSSGVVHIIDPDDLSVRETVSAWTANPTQVFDRYGEEYYVDCPDYYRNTCVFARCSDNVEIFSSSDHINKVLFDSKNNMYIHLTYCDVVEKIVDAHGNIIITGSCIMADIHDTKDQLLIIHCGSMYIYQIPRVPTLVECAVEYVSKNKRLMTRVDRYFPDDIVELFHDPTRRSPRLMNKRIKLTE